MQKYFSILTNTGLNKITSALLNNTKVNFTSMVFGDGNGEYVSPYPAQTALIHQIGQAAVNYVRVKGDNANIIEVSAVIPADEGGYIIREMGILDSEGSLIAVGNMPDTDKAVIEDGIVSELELIMEIMVKNAQGVQLQIDPSVINATKKDVKEVSDRLDAHIKDTVVHFSKEEKDRFNTLENYDDSEIRRILNGKADKIKSYTLLIPAVGWSDYAPYTQKISVNGMVADGLPLYDLIEYSEQAAEDYMKLTKLETFTNEVQVTAVADKPVGNIKIRIEVAY